ncbi:MAG: hypothetical protein SFV15_24750 [Polyangiaceae bacterium]|nr:hypothetical protein [Polyangiaceae bacterium]
MSLVFIVGWLTSQRANAWDALAWGVPQQVRVFRWEDARMPAMLLRSVDPLVDAELLDQELLLSPVKPGQEVRIFGDPVEVGLGSGSRDLPDVITWQAPGAWLRRVAAGVHELRVPTYESARWVVVRSPYPKTRVRLEVALPEVSNILWYRAEENVWRMLEGGPVPTLLGPLASHQSEIRFLDAARRAFPEGVGREFLQSHWLEFAWQERGLGRPYFVSAQVGPAPAPVPLLQQASAPWVPQPDGSWVTSLTEGHTAAVHSDEAEVVTLFVRAHAVGQIRIVVRQGAGLVAVMKQDIARNAEDPARLTPATRFRLPMAPGTPISIQVQRGTAELSISGYRARPSITDGTPIRQRTELLRLGMRGKGASAAERVARVLSKLALCRCPEAVEEGQELLTITTGKVRALVLFELIYQGIGLVDVNVLLPQFWKATAGLEETDRLAFRRQLLQRLTEVDAEPLQVEHLEDVAIRSGFVETEALSEDAFATAALAEMIAVPRDGARPWFAAAAEVRAAERPERADLVELGRRSWFRTAPWSWIDPSGSETISRVRNVYGARPEELCESQGDRGPRWLRLSHTPEPLAIRADSGTHARVLLRSEAEVPAADTSVQVGATQIHVHAGIGLYSSMGLAPGTHEIHVQSGPDILAQLPLAQPVPCGRLREIERWVPIRQSVHFAITRGEVGTVGRLLLDLDQANPKFGEVEVRVQNEVHRAWARAPATGAVEFPLPKDVEAFEVRSGEPVLVRALQRLHKMPKAQAPRALAKLDVPLNEPELLAQVRRSTRALGTSKSAKERATLRLARAKALQDLGYLRLAAVDRVRANQPESDTDRSDATAEWLLLPPGSPPVVALNLLAKIPPLPLPIPSKTLELAFRQRQLGAPPVDVISTLGASAQYSSAVDALLLAVLAEQLGLLEVSASAYERIGHALRSGHALAHSAELRADFAEKEQSLDQTMTAYITARQAEASLVPAGDVLARMDRAIEWVNVSVQGAAGVRWLENEGRGDGNTTLGERTRRALTDAPAEATSSGKDPIEISLLGMKSRSLRVHSLCHASDGQNEYCSFRFEIDHRPVVCGASPVASSARDFVALPTECELTVPEGAARLSVFPPADRDVFGWINAQEKTVTGFAPLVRATRWTEIDVPRPMEFQVVGPTVLKIQTRGLIPGPPSFRVDIVEPGGQSSEAMEPVLSSAVDPVSVLRDVGSQVTVAGRQYVTLPLKGQYRVRLSTPSGRILAKVEAAFAKGFPRARTEDPKEDAAPVVQSGAAPGPAVWPAIGLDPKPGALTLTAFSKYIDDRRLLDEDAVLRTNYAELGVGAGREVIDGTLLGAVSLARRFRAGSDSTHARSSWSLSLGNGLPGAWLDTSFTVQRLQEWRWGAALGTGVSYGVPVTEDFKLIPELALALRRVDAGARGNGEVDSDVYSPYGRTRPATYDAILSALHQPWVDAKMSYRARARLLPSFQGLDRVDGRARFNALVLRDYFPWLGADLELSYRPVSPLRTLSFWRAEVSPGASFWCWTHASGRFVLSGLLAYSEDFPRSRGRGRELSAQLGLRYDMTWLRGLSDYSADERPFQDRLEEGSAPPRRGVAPRDPNWSEPP